MIFVKAGQNAAYPKRQTYVKVSQHDAPHRFRFLLMLTGRGCFAIAFDGPRVLEGEAAVYHVLVC